MHSNMASLTEYSLVTVREGCFNNSIISFRGKKLRSTPLDMLVLLELLLLVTVLAVYVYVQIW